MDAIRKALAVAAKDLRVVSGDRAYVLTMFLVPIIVGFFNAAMHSGGSSTINLPTIIANQDSGFYGESIVEILDEIKEVELTSADTPNDAEEQVRNGTALAAVIIPGEFSQDIDNYQQAEVTVIVDPAQASYGRIMTSILEEITSALAIQGEIRYGIKEVLGEMGYDQATDPDLALAAQAQVEGVIFTQMQRMQVDNPIEVSSETIKGDQVFVWNNVFTLILPAFTVMFAFFIVPAVSTDLLREKESGALRRLVAAPLPRGSLIGGKILAYLLVVIIQVSVIFGIGIIFLDMNTSSSPLGMVLITLAMGLSATSLGMLIASTARSIDQAGSIGVLLVFLLGFLGGSFFPNAQIYKMEGILGWLSRITPQAQAMDGYFSIMVRNGGLMDVLPNILYLLGLSLVFFLIAIWRFRYD